MKYDIMQSGKWCQPFGANGYVHIQGKITVGLLLYRLHIFRPDSAGLLVMDEI
jgi:hypothetical protein